MLGLVTVDHFSQSMACLKRSLGMSYSAVVFDIKWPTWVSWNLLWQRYGGEEGLMVPSTNGSCGVGLDCKSAVLAAAEAIESVRRSSELWPLAALGVDALPVIIRRIQEYCPENAACGQESSGRASSGSRVCVPGSIGSCFWQWKWYRRMNPVLVMSMPLCGFSGSHLLFDEGCTFGLRDMPKGSVRTLLDGLESEFVGLCASQWPRVSQWVKSGYLYHRSQPPSCL